MPQSILDRFNLLQNESEMRQAENKIEEAALVILNYCYQC